MSQWLEDVIAHAEQPASNDIAATWLAKQRNSSLQKLKEQKWPTRRTEAWANTSLAPVESRTAKPAATDITTWDKPAIPGLDSIDIYFVGGQLKTDISALSLPDGLSIYTLQDEKAEAIAASRFAQIKPERHIFGLINDVIAQSGVVVDVAENTTIDSPIRFIHLANEGLDNHSRVLVNVAKHAKVTIIEHGVGEQDSMNTSMSEFDVADNASLYHYRFALFTKKALHVGGCHFQVGEKSYINSTIVGFGGDLSKLNIDVNYTGEHSNVDINAMYLLAEGEAFDLQSTLEHAVPNGTSNEKVHGIIGDRARANFGGRIHIHRDAQKTLAQLNNRNLLLSRRALINTKPELEIYADDVRCAHGATIAEIDDESLYYLLTRGIPRSQALIMLNFGFIQELINEIETDAIRDWLTDMLSTRFKSMEVS